MRYLFLTVIVLAITACPSPGAGNADSPEDSVTQRQRYEAVGESNLPGARGVRGALDATDEMEARDAQRDSILQDR